MSLFDYRNESETNHTRWAFPRAIKYALFYSHSQFLQQYATALLQGERIPESIAKGVKNSSTTTLMTSNNTDILSRQPNEFPHDEYTLANISLFALDLFNGRVEVGPTSHGKCLWHCLVGAKYGLYLNPWILDMNETLENGTIAKDTLVCVIYAIVIHEIAHHIQLRLLTTHELLEQRKQSKGDVGKELERLNFGGVVRSNANLSALHIEDHSGVTFDVNPREFREYFLGRPKPKIHFHDWDVTRFPIVSKDESLVGMDELNGTHGTPNYSPPLGRCTDPE